MDPLDLCVLVNIFRRADRERAHTFHEAGCHVVERWAPYRLLVAEDITHDGV